MKLAYFMNMRMPTEKAHGIQVMKMCEAFARQGITVRLFVSNRRTHIIADPFEYYGVEPVFRITRLFSLDTVRYGRIGFYLQWLTFLLSALVMLLITRPGYVYTRDPWIARLARFCRIRAIGWEVHTALAPWICRAGGKSATAVIPISAGLREHLVQAGVPQRKVHTEHDGVDLHEFEQLPGREEARSELSLPGERLIIAYVGKLKTMGESKGVEEIIACVGELRRELPAVFMLVVGINDTERETAQSLSRETGLSEDDVALIPHISRASIPLYLRAASVLVMNYPDLPHYARMMSPLKLFEYMASGTPIVSSDLPSIREVLDEESAFLVEPGSNEQLKRGIRAAVIETDDASARAARARSLVTEYTWEARARRILSLLAEA